MKLLNLRWGEDEGGIACGPCGGSVLVETAVCDEDGGISFVLITSFDGCNMISISRTSLFDLFRLSAGRDVDTDRAIDIMEKACLYRDEYDIQELPPDYNEVYDAAIRFTAQAVNEYYMLDRSVNEQASAAAYWDSLESYDLDQLDLPSWDDLMYWEE